MATILIIEADPTVQELLTVLLQLEGYQVRTADHGADALVQLQHPVDLVLSALHLPGLDGLAFYHSLRTDPAYCALPFIFLSPVPLCWTTVDPLVTFLAPPLHPDRLLATIARLIAHTQHERDGA